MKIAFITDIEGSINFFNNAVAVSPLLTYNTTGNLTFTDNTSYFVFGGDLIDKGPHDTFLCQLLVTFKLKHPSRVHLLLGNRDLNKLRYAAELSDQDLARDISTIPKPHWDLSVPSIHQYLQSIATTTSSTLTQVNTKTNRLKWILLHTLGCRDTFEFRRQEIARETNNAHIADIQVTTSFITSVTDPTSYFRQFLNLGCIAVRLADTIFVHGALDINTFGFVPDSNTKFEMPTSKSIGTHIDNVDEWISAINNYLTVGLKDFEQRPNWNATRTSRGGESLMALQNRDAMYGRSVVSNCFSDGGCITTKTAEQQRNKKLIHAATDPHAFNKLYSDPFNTTVVNWLLKGGICRQVVGHKPSSDCPAVLAGSVTGVEIVSADTSFSDMSAADNRGNAASAVTIYVDEKKGTSYLVIEGVLHDGTEHRAKFPTLKIGMDGNGGSGEKVEIEGDEEKDECGDPYVGTLVEDDWWVQTKVGMQYRLIRGAGRNWETKMVDEVAKCNL
jgi:hypothetical protein